MLSEQLNAVVNRLKGDWNFIAKFLDDSEDALKDFELLEDEKQMLITRNVDKLVTLGFSEAQALGAASGAHSQTCKP